ncbi:Hypothetical predicted protein [Paramuricea clavata]|uniref:Uncharacterized protein n=1 Tax=Paramuricea clavata TaxID=317549 RepID=A0A6S7KG21_PARCT|nr:Hypothetical predicted protein [Paramuricea clavata]
MKFKLETMTRFPALQTCRQLICQFTQPTATSHPTKQHEISCAIRLSYDCDDEWASKCDEWLNNSIKQKADAIPPKCSECPILQDENARLKGTIARLLNVPPAAVIYLESLATYLRDASSDEDCNDEVMEISFPHMAMNKTQKTPPTPVSKTNVTNTSAVNIHVDTPYVDTPSSSPLSHFEGGNGKQELCPGSGVFIPTIKLRKSHHKSGSDLKVLFHCLMEHFRLAMSVAFGNQVLPMGKQVLDPNIVSTIKGTSNLNMFSIN